MSKFTDFLNDKKELSVGEKLDFAIKAVDLFYKEIKNNGEKMNENDFNNLLKSKDFLKETDAFFKNVLSVFKDEDYQKKLKHSDLVKLMNLSNKLYCQFENLNKDLNSYYEEKGYYGFRARTIDLESILENNTGSLKDFYHKHNLNKIGSNFELLYKLTENYNDTFFYLIDWEKMKNVIDSYADFLNKDETFLTKNLENKKIFNFWADLIEHDELIKRSFVQNLSKFPMGLINSVYKERAKNSYAAQDAILLRSALWHLENGKIEKSSQLYFLTTLFFDKISNSMDYNNVVSNSFQSLIYLLGENFKDNVLKPIKNSESMSSKLVMLDKLLETNANYLNDEIKFKYDDFLKVMGNDLESDIKELFKQRHYHRFLIDLADIIENSEELKKNFTPVLQKWVEEVYQDNLREEQNYFNSDVVNFLNKKFSTIDTSFISEKELNKAYDGFLRKQKEKENSNLDRNLDSLDVELENEMQKKKEEKIKKQGKKLIDNIIKSL